MAIEEKNFFDLFSIEKSFDVDIRLLTDRFREIQKKIHPDNFATSTEQERVLALRQSGLINDAFQTLKDPVRRGKYLLNLFGFNIDANQTISDSNFLFEQMTLRESLENAKRVPNALSTIEELLNEIEIRIASINSDVSKSFRDPPSRDALQLAANKLNQLQFFSKLREEAKDIEAQCD